MQSSLFNFETVQVPGAGFTDGPSINNRDQLVGSYGVSPGVSVHASLYTNGQFLTIDAPGRGGPNPGQRRERPRRPRGELRAGPSWADSWISLHREGFHHDRFTWRQGHVPESD
jgi:hypothetical protein